jgi:hypothetical protein
LSGRTQAPRPEDPGGPPAGERNVAENWAHFAEEVLRQEDAKEGSATGPPEILLPSGTGIVQTPLFQRFGWRKDKSVTRDALIF